MKYFFKIKGLRLSLMLIIIVIIGSCTKDDKSNCYICRTTYIVTTDQAVPGYPATTTTDVELCDITQEQITEFETTNKGSDASVIGGVTYSSSYATKCEHE